jgi:CBS domain-containing protein
MGTTVEQVMGRVAIAVRRDARFTDIVATMRRFAVGAVAVIDADRRPVGVVSEDDLLLKETGDLGRRATVLDTPARRRDREKAAGTTAEELMTSPAITVTPGTSVRDAARLMHDHRIKQLPVIDPVTGRMVGTVHQSDLLRVFDRSAGELAAAARKVIRETGADLAKLSVTVRQGVLTVTGEVATRAQAERVADELRRLEGVVDVVCELTYREDDLLVVPPLL